MNILFIFARHSENPNDSTLTKDLSDEFSKKGNKVTVVTLLEKRNKRNTELKIENGYKVLRARTNNYFNVGKIEKGITVLTISRCLKNNVLKYLGEEKYDLIITHTPFISAVSLVNPLKKYFNCPAHLILWDIFPQNARDIGIINNNFIFKFFKMKEEKMLSIYDKIWCMSKGNAKYMKDNYKFLKDSKIDVLKNWALIKPEIKIDKKKIREKYGYSIDDFILIFGGNMGRPQKLENILKLSEKCLKFKEVKFLFVGSGTEKKRLEELSFQMKLKNVKFLNQVPRRDYEELTGACDVGIVSLDERFTVPNFPSKTTDYFKLSLPILASLDKCSMEDYGMFLENEVKGGISALTKDLDDVYEKFIKLYNNKDLRIKLGENGRKYYEQYLGVDKAYKTIMEELKKDGR